MNLMKIMDKANELTIYRFNIGMKIAYSFIVVDTLLLIVGFMGLYSKSVTAFIDPETGDHHLVLYLLLSHPY